MRLLSIPPRVRCSDADRHAVVSVLLLAYCRGWLTMVEFDSRIQWAHSVIRRDDLDALIADLPTAMTDRP